VVDAPPQLPFDTVEGAREYVRLLAEAIAEAEASVQDDIAAACAEGASRRVDALRLVAYKLEKLRASPPPSGGFPLSFDCFRSLSTTSVGSPGPTLNLWVLGSSPRRVTNLQGWLVGGITPGSPKALERRSGQEYVRWESPRVPRECPVCGEMATNHATYYDVDEPPAPMPDDRKPVSEEFEHANKGPCSRFNEPASS
jgi:hypothetical protein